MAQARATRAKRRGRPPAGDETRRAISLRVDVALLAQYRARAKARGVGYQTLMHEALVAAVK